MNNLKKLIEEEGIEDVCKALDLLEKCEERGWEDPVDTIIGLLDFIKCLNKAIFELMPADKADEIIEYAKDEYKDNYC